MADIVSSMSGMFSGTGATIKVFIIIVIAIVVVLVVCGLLFFLYWNKKRFNLTVEIKKVRSDGKMITGEIGKGLYNAKRGVVLIKRKGVFGTTPMRVFDVRRYLQGEDLLTVIQVAAGDFRPVLAESWTEHIVEYEDETTGKVSKIKEAVINIKVDAGLNKAWKSSWDAAAKNAYSLRSFLTQFQVPISIAIVLIAVFVGFAILYQRMPSLCGH